MRQLSRRLDCLHRNGMRIRYRRVHEITNPGPECCACDKSNVVVARIRNHFENLAGRGGGLEQTATRLHWYDTVGITMNEGRRDRDIRNLANRVEGFADQPGQPAESGMRSEVPSCR